jgi:hypothetical protein
MINVLGGKRTSAKLNELLDDLNQELKANELGEDNDALFE